MLEVDVRLGAGDEPVPSGCVLLVPVPLPPVQNLLRLGGRAIAAPSITIEDFLTPHFSDRFQKKKIWLFKIS